MAATTLASSDDAAELLMMVRVVIHSLLRKEGDEDDAQLEHMKEMVRECGSMALSRRDQSAVSKELLAVTQRMLDAQLRSLDGGEQRRVVVSSSASDHQLMESAAAAKKKEKAASVKKKKRNKRNKAAKHKGTKLKSWLGGGIISLLMMAAFGSTTTLITHSLVPRSDGSSEGKAPPTLPPSTSTSLRQRKLQTSYMASMSPASLSPLAAVVQAPVFSPDTVSNRRRKSADERALSTCFDTPY